jgi:hypothetical protein
MYEIKNLNDTVTAYKSSGYEGNIMRFDRER